MDRRKFIGAVACGVGLAPLGAFSQQRTSNIPRLGVLLFFPLTTRRQNWDAFKKGLADLGYVEDRTILIEFVSADGDEGRLGELAQKLVEEKVDIIVSAGTQAIQAASKATKTIPIVMASIGDPVGAGVVASLAHPGGNVTGMSLIATDLSAKRLQLLKEMLPRLQRAAVLSNPDNASVILKVREFLEAGRDMGIAIQAVDVRRPSDLDVAIGAAAAARAEAIMDTGDALQTTYRAKIVELATGYRMPVMSEFSSSIASGALCSYGPSSTDVYRRAATYVDRILKGARPGDLPIEQPTKLELVINLKTAKALGLTIPHSLLLRADNIVE
jgi:putative ABC transport system substrate-binding protein